MDNELKLAELRAFADIGDLFRPDGSVLTIDELPPDVAATVAMLEVTETEELDEAGEKITRRTVKIHLHDKAKNMEIIAHHFNLFPVNEEVQESSKGGRS
jgi:hypothetical protein